ncbi:chemotaxis protein CheD [Parvularcula sp. LCG005]|uniref:chemotaxis protein CheD n=1 Tax=Parvularcula sp. LCG005 TaxID=3078805 RepID=UPI0029438613|nr:chemotaxis protein CheD [Parvularcula sp. LCG005]WOI52619.1 chemotaxis protein CheD [Parvularcula sp. LCG005]
MNSIISPRPEVLTPAPDRAIHVIQGESAVSDEPNVYFSTVLGSCIAACLYDPAAKVGGMNHFLLAESVDSLDGDLKYGVHAMECLINSLLRSGARRSSLVAKVFGGARLISGVSDIGRKNVIFIKTFLENENIPCLSHSVGGERARRVKFWPTTGSAKQLLLEVSESVSVERRPKRAAPKPAGGDLELF